VSVDNPAGSLPESGQPGAAFCFRVKQERPGWNVLAPIPAKTTVDLAALVCGAPEFLGMDGGEARCQAAVVLSERGDVRVVVAVDEVGGIVLVGCPAQLTRDALTTVVQELLVFTGRLWRMPSGEFSAVFEKRLGRSLGDYFSGRVAIGWSEPGFRAGLKQSLERGRFPVVLLLAETNRDVAEAIAHLKSHNLAVRPLGVDLYESSGVEIVLPRVIEVAEPGPYEEKEPARLVPRPTPPQPRTPQRSQLSSGQVANFGAPGSAPSSEPAPAKKMPWSDQTAPQAAAPTPAPVKQVVHIGALDSAPPPGPAPAAKMPWSDQPAPVELKPVAAEPQPAPRPAPAARPVWDGTMPGVMAGRRPAPKPPLDSETRRGQEQPAGRR